MSSARQSKDNQHNGYVLWYLSHIPYLIYNEEYIYEMGHFICQCSNTICHIYNFMCRTAYICNLDKPAVEFWGCFFESYYFLFRAQYLASFFCESLQNVRIDPGTIVYVLTKLLCVVSYLSSLGFLICFLYLCSLYNFMMLLGLSADSSRPHRGGGGGGPLRFDRPQASRWRQEKWNRITNLANLVGGTGPAFVFHMELVMKSKFASDSHFI